MKKKRKVLLSILSSCILIMAYMFVEPYWIKVTYIKVKDSDIPDSFDGKRIVFASDIHHGPYFSRERVRNMVEKVNSLNPDIIFVGGDYVEKSREYIKPCFEELSHLEAPLGRFGVLGNHDYYRNGELVRQSMKEAGITLLDNAAQWITYGSGRIKVCGVGYFNRYLYPIESYLEDVGEDDFVILLSHDPDYAETIRNYKIDIVLSGHTHGGQVTLFGLWAPYIPSIYGQKYRTGVADTKYTRVYVSNGVGTSGIPIRFFARPEIVVLELVKEK
ncbi:MAG TPA: metallophosphoesterase [Acetivibrio sp.]|uniref:metallophosphoesterase n=1 Tax=Acetivibrio sp. TaxID=1872092 RepID=UPI002BF7A1B2|nr:metallophosphoesterase [Acetivibrio sp.]HOM03570.1 metallophosphoesterase [Acetivibrio sp.]